MLNVYCIYIKFLPLSNKQILHGINEIHTGLLNKYLFMDSKISPYDQVKYLESY